MSGDTVECFNCGHANPSWAQVCRSCGFALIPDGPQSGAPRGLVPTDQASLISIGGTLGAIVLAIVLGLILSGLIPEVGAEPTLSPSASGSVVPSASAVPSVAVSVAPSVVVAPPLPGTLSFGTGINADKQVTDPTNSFTAGMAFAHSIAVTEPFGVNTVSEEITRVADGVVVQTRESGAVQVVATSTIAGFRVKNASVLINAWGVGEYTMRIYRGVELLAEGQFTLS